MSLLALVTLTIWTWHLLLHPNYAPGSSRFNSSYRTATRHGRVRLGSCVQTTNGEVYNACIHCASGTFEVFIKTLANRYILYSGYIRYRITCVNKSESCDRLTIMWRSYSVDISRRYFGISGFQAFFVQGSSTGDFFARNLFLEVFLRFILAVTVGEFFLGLVSEVDFSRAVSGRWGSRPFFLGTFYRRFFFRVDFLEGPFFWRFFLRFLFDFHMGGGGVLKAWV